MMMMKKGEQLIVRIADPDVRAAIQLHEEVLAKFAEAINDLATALERQRAALDYNLSVLMNRLDALEQRIRLQQH